MNRTGSKYIANRNVEGYVIGEKLLARLVSKPSIFFLTYLS